MPSTARAKWSAFWQNRYRKTNYSTTYGQHLYDLEAETTSKELLQLGIWGARFLSVGPGLGQVETGILSRLPQGLCRSLVGLDVVENVLKSFVAGSQVRGGPVAGVVADASAQYLPFADSSFDVVLSFGRASLASYRVVVPEVIRVTKEGGIVVMDFINHLSPYQLLKDPTLSLRRFLWCVGILNGADVYPNFGRFGIRHFYAQHGLALRRLSYIGSALPVRGLSLRGYRALEACCFAKRFLGRVLLGVFEKRETCQS